MARSSKHSNSLTLDDLRAGLWFCPGCHKKIEKRKLKQHRDHCPKEARRVSRIYRSIERKPRS